MNMNLYGHDVSRGIALFNRKDSMFSAVFCMVKFGNFHSCIDSTQTLQYFEQLNSSTEGWKLCATHFTQNTSRWRLYLYLHPSPLSLFPFFTLLPCSYFIPPLHVPPSSRVSNSDHVQFFCLQVVERHIRARHACSSDDDILTLRRILLSLMQVQYIHV